MTGGGTPHDHLMRATPAPHRGVFYPLGHNVIVESNDRRPLEMMQDLYGRFPAVAGRRPLHLRIVRDDRLTGAPPWPAGVHRASGDLLACCRADNLCLLDLRRMYGAAFFSEAMLADAAALRSMFYFLIYMPLLRLDGVPVHAATVVRDGRAICLLGGPGAGKTSLAYYLGRQGFPVVAEDFTFLRRSKPPRVAGIITHFHFTPDAPQLFPEVIQFPLVDRNGERAIVVKAEDLGIVPSVAEHEVGAVVLLTRDANPGLQPVSAREAATRMYETLPWDRPGVLRRQRAAIHAAVAGGAYRLGYRSLAEAFELLQTVPLSS
jgi:hypothetical protein